MKAKVSLLLVLAMALGSALGCSRASSRTDAQIASDVQNKIYNDRNLQNPQVVVNSADGVVTLSGSVSSQSEWNAAATDAGQVDGVKRVVNNLQVMSVAVQPPAAEANAPLAPQAAVPAPRRRGERASLPPGQRRGSSYSEPASNASSMPMQPTAAAPVRSITVPDGTMLSIRLIDPVDSERNNPGDTFRASVDAPVVVNDQVVIPQDADITGRVVTVQSAGRFAGRSALAIELTKLTVNGKSYDLHTNQFSRQGSSEGKATATKVGGGAALGAIIGGIAGGGKGAAIGAGVGAGAGTGVAAAKKGQQIRLTSEQVLNFRLESPVTIVPQATSQRNAGRQRLDQ